MESDDKKCVLMTALFVLAFAVLVTAIAIHYTLECRWAMQNGYEEVSIPGNQCPVWQKAK